LIIGRLDLNSIKYEAIETYYRTCIAKIKEKTLLLFLEKFPLPVEPLKEKDHPIKAKVKQRCKGKNKKREI
jgi:hypothetical protein